MSAPLDAKPLPTAAEATARPETRDDVERPAALERPTRCTPSPAASDFAELSTLGEGGMGRVLLVRQRSLERDVALKTLKPDASADDAAALLREARITGGLEHPGIVPIHLLAFDDAGRPMLVMKRVDGTDLHTLLADDAHPAWQARGNGDRLTAALEILVQVCITLEFAHSQGVVHGDIKPKNVMVGSFGEVYLLDWGVASVMASSDVTPDGLRGTPAYMPPEMAFGRPIDQRTDVYLVGATLHEILVGKPRHEGATSDDVLRSSARSTPFVYPESVPEALVSLCHRAMARSPAARPARIQAVREELEAFIRHSSSRVLNEAALDRLIQLEELLAQPAPLAFDVARAYRLTTEARFGFALGLRAHPDDPAARSGMRRCLTLAIEVELRQQHADSAEALLGEMDVADPELARRIEEVRERTAADVRERRQLEQLADDFDPSQHSWIRGICLCVFLVVGVAIGRVITLGGNLSAERVALGSAVSTVLFCVGLVGIRHSFRVIWNAFNKQLIALIIVTMGIVVTHRVIGVLHRIPPHETMTIDLVIVCGAVIYSAYAFLPRLAYAAVPLAAGLPLALLWPHQAPFIFVAALVMGTPAAAWVAMNVPKPDRSDDSHR